VIISFPENEIEFEINGPKEKVFIPAEPLLEEVFHNIFHNAAKYHDVVTPKIVINVRNDNEANKVVIEVIDRGRGIPDQMKSRLFTRPDKADEAKHIGMGLSLVKVLLDRYNGSIVVEDRVSGNHRMGSKFTVILPSIDTEASLQQQNT
jgi:signal transduction histidine kinase